jgi:tripartite ATP-independent transporter DctM subunit
MGHFRGGLSHANIASSIVFAGVSGSAVADAAAVGSVMIPAMREDGYPSAYAAAVTASSATLGLVIPPSIPMVIFALFTPAEVATLFLAGVVPGLAMGALLIFMSFFICLRRGYPVGPWQGMGELWAALRGSFLALLMPVLVIYGLVSGVATTAEVGAIAALYAALVSLVIYRETSLAEFFRAACMAGTDAARVLIIIAVSGAFVWIVARLGVAGQLAAWLGSLDLSPVIILATIALLLLLLGTVLEPITILIVIAPIITPAAMLAGVDVTQLGIVVVLASAIGLVTPPVGVLIYLTAAQAQAPALAVVRQSLPFIAMLVLLLGLVVVFPSLTLWLPAQFAE